MMFFRPTVTCIATVLATTATVVNAAVQELIPVGNRRPEAIAILPDGEAAKLGLGDGTYGLVSEYYFGGVIAVNLEDGSVSQLIPSTEFGERSMLGLAYKDGVIFAANGGPRFVHQNLPPAVYALNGATGETIVNCEPEGVHSRWRDGVRDGYVGYECVGLGFGGSARGHMQLLLDSTDGSFPGNNWRWHSWFQW